MSRRARQLGFKLRYKGHRGPKERAGRPKKQDSGVSHLRRPAVTRHVPVHVNWRVEEGIESLRRVPTFRAMAKAFQVGKDRFGFRLVHYSVQSNHLHLIVEADDKQALSRGMQGLAIRLAKAVNRVLQRHGAVFADRFYAHYLRSKREVARAIAYVLGNWFLHAGREVGPWDVDQLSSVAEPGTTVQAQSWLLRFGWMTARP
jgi:REP element-mobilizing transposase RayT